MKTFSKYLAKITLLVILATFLYLPASIKVNAQAAQTAPAADSNICKWINAQNGSSGATGGALNGPVIYTSPPPTGKPDTEEYKAAQNARIQEFMRVVAEGDAAKKKAAGTYFADKLVVIVEEPLGVPAADFSTTCARVTKCSTNLYDANNPKEVRKCFTSYDTPNKCRGPADETESTTPGGQANYYCEIVQVYWSDGGTSLLYGYIGQVYRYVAVLGGFIAVLVLIIAGVMYSASGAEPELATKAKALATKCITGLIVLFLSAVILYTINPNFFVF